MNRLTALFKNKPQQVLSVYFTAGFPRLDDTVTVIKELQQCGVDLVEIGFPFSDPLADGPIIQHSSEVALSNGMKLPLLFEQLAGIRKAVHIPLILMGYLNPVLQLGMENFCKNCRDTGIDGIILPDLPLQEYLDEYKPLFDRYGLVNIFLITPQTSDERIRYIDAHSNSFIYMVSASSTTGTKMGVDALKEKYFERIQGLNLSNPTLIGFGISDHDSFTKACRYSNGAIIGSSFIQTIEKSTDLKTDIRNFVGKIKGSALVAS